MNFNLLASQAEEFVNYPWLIELQQSNPPCVEDIAKWHLPRVGQDIQGLEDSR